jgi:acylphosphatase
MAIKQFRALVRGRVQGVSYRATTVEVGRSLDLAGHARNKPDGSVEVIARGEESALRELIEFLHIGPSLARVTEVEVDWSDSTPAPVPFSTSY